MFVRDGLFRRLIRSNSEVEDVFADGTGGGLGFQAFSGGGGGWGFDGSVGKSETEEGGGLSAFSSF